MLLLYVVAVALAPAPLTIDPAIGRILRTSSSGAGSLSEVSAAADGLSVWRGALAAGRVPDWEGIDEVHTPWPPSPLRAALADRMLRLGLPRTTARHPSLIAATLAAVLAAHSQFSEAKQEYDTATGSVDTEKEDVGSDGTRSGDIGVDPRDNGGDDDCESNLVEAAEQIAEAFAKEWSAPLRGVRAVEGLGSADGADIGSLTAAPGDSFSTADGLWQHNGWTALETVQQQLKQMSELSELISNLGQRASCDGVPSRGAKSVADERAAPSAALSELAPREISGLAQTRDVSRVAPSELSLLCTAPGAEEADLVGSGSNNEGGRGGGGRRRLFLSRLAEGRLLGYSLEGWMNERGRPKRRRLQRLPRERGGPLVVCLDTSHSMAGGREKIAKAVVLEAVRAAHESGRPCLLFAFSGSSDLAELRLTPPRRRRRRPPQRMQGGGGGTAGATNRAGLKRLLDFLGCSFGGGTDVAGPLRRAMDVLERPDQSEVVFSGADVLLVSDGELPDPPLDAPTFARLRALRQQQGVEVHGLLVGQPRPTPLDSMCDEVHTCLSRFDPLALLREKAAEREEQAADAAARRMETRRAARAASRGRAPVMMALTDDRPAAPSQERLPATLRERAAARVESVLGPTTQVAASAGVSATATQGAARSATVAYETILAAGAKLERGLIEREAEARLLLLALVGGEHLLLLGPPGTAKSELCRRLSAVAGLTYFERTLTRFSTPEELFGPLSLTALERDEFLRATAGYAPDAELLFIDEIFKSNSAILNTLLTLLNERLFDNGASRARVPLLSAVAASNEGPESEELAALYDRFLLRKLVTPVSDDGVLTLLLGAGDGGEDPPSDEAAATPDQLRCALDEVLAAAPSVELPRWVALLLRDARSFVRELGDEAVGGGYVSDRRLRRTAELLKSSAAAHGRHRVSIADVLAVLPHVLWEEAEEAGQLEEWVEANALPRGDAEQLAFLLSSIQDRAGSVVAADGDGDADDLNSITEDAAALSLAAIEAASEMRAHVLALDSAREHLFLAPARAAAVMQRLLPEARERAGALEELALRATALELALTDGQLTGESLDEAIRVAGDEQTDAAALEGHPAADDHDEEQPDDGGGGFAFTDEELSWGRKVAKARLAPEEFKAWRKAVKLASKKA